MMDVMKRHVIVVVMIVGSLGASAVAGCLAARGMRAETTENAMDSAVRPAAEAPVDCCGPEPAPAPRGKGRILRISADPNNLPFTNDKLEGFENRIAAILGREMKADVEYIWRAQRRGFFRNALKEGECDLVLGVPVGFDMALTTSPYYRSSYVFVTRKESKLDLKGFDDPALKSLKIGVQMIGDDGMNTPPAHALAARGLIDNVVGFTLYGDYREANPPARIIEAVANGDIDTAVAWGPMAGYFASRQNVPLTVTPVQHPPEDSGLRFAFSIAMGVRKGNKALRDEVDGTLQARKAEIDSILDSYGVPRVAAPTKR
jgi:quinoprotein dehydrogenase-associated probable ABC transporter substrate-binding protein